MIRFKKLLPNAQLPTRATDYSVGYDLAVAEDTQIPWGGHALLRTGLQLADMSIPYFGLTELQIRPRSSLYKKFGLIIPNSPGTIDPDYRGELLISVLHVPEVETFLFPSIYIPAGTKVAQLVINSVEIRDDMSWAEEVVATERGSGGFGSTG